MFFTQFIWHPLKYRAMCPPIYTNVHNNCLCCGMSENKPRIYAEQRKWASYVIIIMMENTHIIAFHLVVKLLREFVQYNAKLSLFKHNNSELLVRDCNLIILLQRRYTRFIRTVDCMYKLPNHIKYLFHKCWGFHILLLWIIVTE